MPWTRTRRLPAHRPVEPAHAVRRDHGVPADGLLECKFFDMSDPTRSGVQTSELTAAGPRMEHERLHKDRANARSGKVDIGPPSYRGAA